jgi:hypothetical protein
VGRTSGSSAHPRLRVPCGRTRGPPGGS